MATAQTGLVVSANASADLSAKQYYAVKIDASGEIAVCGDGEPCVGSLLNKPDAQGKSASVQIGGIAKFVFSASVAEGTEVASDAAGKITAAVTGDSVIGVCFVDGGADGQVGEVLMGFGAEKN